MAAAAQDCVYSGILIPLGKNKHPFLKSQGKIQIILHYFNICDWVSCLSLNTYIMHSLAQS